MSTKIWRTEIPVREESQKTITLNPFIETPFLHLQVINSIKSYCIQVKANLD